MNLCLFRCTRDAQVEKVTVSSEIFSLCPSLCSYENALFFTRVTLIAFFSLALAIYGLLLQLNYFFINYSFCFLFRSGYRSTLFYITVSRNGFFSTSFSSGHCSRAARLLSSSGFFFNRFIIWFQNFFSTPLVIRTQ